MKLGELCDIKINFPDADFWMIAAGSEDTVGTVGKEYRRDYIGIKVIKTDILVPDYLYYLMQYLKMSNQLSSITDKNQTVHRITPARLSNIQLQPRE